MDGMKAAEPSVWNGNAEVITSRVIFEVDRTEDMFRAAS
jgi:hypothetical protein